jgi:hypothetical protein
MINFTKKPAEAVRLKVLERYNNHNRQICTKLSPSSHLEESYVLFVSSKEAITTLKKQITKR